MSQSLYTSMGGYSQRLNKPERYIQQHANLNTTAFKTSSVNFSDVFQEQYHLVVVRDIKFRGYKPYSDWGRCISQCGFKRLTSGSWIATVRIPTL